MKNNLLRTLLLCLFLAAAATCRAIELKISTDALQRTLETQLFTDNGRFYLRGNNHSACYVFADSPKVSTVGDRAVVHLHVTAKIGPSVGGQCMGIRLSRDVDVSMAPDAEGESIGFRDARIEKLSGSRELDLLLMPFLSHRVPSSMKINAAEQIRKVLAKSSESIGYTVTLDSMKVQSMTIDGDGLTIDVDGGLSVK
jgi:hypothetical protein